VSVPRFGRNDIIARFRRYYKNVVVVAAAAAAADTIIRIRAEPNDTVGDDAPPAGRLTGSCCRFPMRTSSTRRIRANIVFYINIYTHTEQEGPCTCCIYKYTPLARSGTSGILSVYARTRRRRRRRRWRRRYNARWGLKQYTAEPKKILCYAVVRETCARVFIAVVPDSDLTSLRTDPRNIGFEPFASEGAAASQEPGHRAHICRALLFTRTSPTPSLRPPVFDIRLEEPSSKVVRRVPGEKRNRIFLCLNVRCVNQHIQIAEVPENTKNKPPLINGLEFE